MTGDDKVRTITDAAAHHAVNEAAPSARRRRALTYLAAGVLVGCLAAGGWYFGSRIGSLQDQADELKTQADSNGRDARQLADQVKDLGGDPVVEPPAASERGADGAAGADGRDGPAGKDGANGRDGPPGRDGDDGPPGAGGPPGSEGQAGATPPCMAEPAQCRGGDGADGRDGQDGAQGQPGPTCPNGYTARSRTYDPNPLLGGDEETWWVCVADGGQT